MQALVPIALVALLASSGCAGFEQVAPDGRTDGRTDRRPDAGADGPTADHGSLDTSGDGPCGGRTFIEEQLGEGVATANSANTAVAIDRATGVVHLVYLPSPTEQDQLLYTRQGADGSWSTPQQLNVPGADVAMPVVAVSSSGAVHVVYSEINALQLIHASLDDGSGWSSAPVPGKMGWVRIAVDGDDRLHLLSMGNYQARYHLYRDGSWLPPQVLSEDATSSPRHGGVAVSSDRVHVAYCEKAGRLVLRERALASGTFDPPLVLAEGLDEDSCGVALAVDGTDGLHALYAETPGSVPGPLRHLARPAGGTPGAPVEVARAKSHAIDFGGYTIVADGDRLWVVHVTGNERVGVVHRSTNGSWDTPLEIHRQASYGISAAIGVDRRLQVFAWSPFARRLERFFFCHPSP